MRSIVGGHDIDIDAVELAVASGCDLATVMAELGARDMTVAELGENVARAFGNGVDERVANLNMYIVELLLAAGYASEADAAEWIEAIGGTGQLLSDSPIRSADIYLTGTLPNSRHGK
jgi:hypothetical protein